ncbi:MAG: hypothetical protein OEX02_12760 [Cyclobacteriaceae bacterium]|nr:hypothetical protein [Cyclobacteriaceae bacterium]
MKRPVYIIILLLLSWTARTQNVATNISDAKSAYSNGNYEDARFALQQALNELDRILAGEIMKLLPDQTGGLSVNSEKDEVTTAGGTGIFVSRYFGEEENTYAKVDIVDNSPMVSMVSAFINNPMMSAMGSTSGQKMIKVHGYKGMIQQDADEIEYSIMVPFGDSMFTFETNVKDEALALEMAHAIPLDKIIALIN